MMRTHQLREHYRSLEKKLRLRKPQIWGYFFTVPSVRYVDALADLANATGLVFASISRDGRQLECWFDAIEAHTLATFIARYRHLEALARAVPGARFIGCDAIALKLGLSRDLRANGKRWRFLERSSDAETREIQQALNKLMAAAAQDPDD